VTATSDSSILWMCSDRQLFALGTNGRTGGQCAGLHITAAPQIVCDTARCTALAFWGNVWKVGQSALIFLLLAPCPQNSVKP